VRKVGPRPDLTRSTHIGDGELTVPNDELLGEELVEDDLASESEDEEDEEGEGGFGEIADLELVEEGGEE